MHPIENRTFVRTPGDNGTEILLVVGVPAPHTTMYTLRGRTGPELATREQIEPVSDDEVLRLVNR